MRIHVPFLSSCSQSHSSNLNCLCQDIRELRDQCYIVVYIFLVSELVGALNPVNYKGLHQGWTQTSFYLQVIHFTSYDTTSWGGSGETIYIPRALNMGTCIQQGDLFYSAHLHRNEKNRRGFGRNAGEWTRRVEISKEEIPGSKRSGYMLTYSRL